MNKKTIIYGGGGFIGSHIAEGLIAEGYDVTIFDKLNFDKRNISHLGKKIKVIEGDFHNEIELKDSIKHAGIVFHLVSSTLPASSNQNPVYDAETNLISTLRLLGECVKHKIEKVIFISSGGTVYGIPEELPIKESHHRRPICSYGIIKKTIEDYLFMYNKLYNLDYNVFRLSNPYGERQNPFVAQGVIPVFLKKMINKETIEIWGDGEVTRDYIYIKDVVKAINKSINKKTPSNVYNLGSGIGYSLNEILVKINRQTGLTPKVRFQKGRDVDVPVNILDVKLLKNELNWKPETEIEQGIRITYDYLKTVLKK
jgi:UDP-glucose 4-epimerase